MLFFGTVEVAIIEEESMFRMLLKQHCEKWGYSVVADCGNGREGIVRGVATRPDLALVGMELSIYSGLQVAFALRKKVPVVKLMMTTTEPDRRSILQARRIGVESIFDRSVETMDRMELCLRAVLDGKPYFSPSVLAALNQRPAGPSLGGSMISEG